MKKSKLKSAALLAALVMLSGCAQKLENNGALPEAENGGASSSADLAESSASEDSAEVYTADIPLLENGGSISVLACEGSVVDYRAAAELFKAAGGEVSLSYCAEDMLFDSISAKALADKRVDIASFDNGLMYPYGVSKDMLEPIDTLIDLNSSRYSNIMLAAELFNIGGLHYVLPLNVSSAYGLYYYPDTVTEITGTDPAEYAENGEWTIDRLEQMLKAWYEYKGDEDDEPRHTPGLSGEYGTSLYLSTGRTLIGYDRNSSGFFNNSFDPEIAEIADRLYSFKQKGYINDTGFINAEEALGSGAMFYSGSFAEAQKNGADHALKAVPFPTEDGSVRYYHARIDGAVLVKGIEQTEAARVFLECAMQAPSALEGELADVFTPPRSARPVYPYGYGLAPKLSQDASKPDDGFPHAVIPLMYSAPYYTGTWEAVCAYFSKTITSELSRLNNELA